MISINVCIRIYNVIYDDNMRFRLKSVDFTRATKTTYQWSILLLLNFWSTSCSDSSEVPPRVQCARNSLHANRLPFPRPDGVYSSVRMHSFEYERTPAAVSMQYDYIMARIFQTIRYLHESVRRFTARTTTGCCGGDAIDVAAHTLRRWFRHGEIVWSHVTLG